MILVRSLLLDKTKTSLHVQEMLESGIDPN